MLRFICFATALVWSPFALALDVNFSGTLTSTCVLALQTPGTLALSGDGTILGSEEGLGLAATVTILSIGTSSIDVAAPVRVGADPVGYNSGTETLQVSYAGASGLSAVSQAYTNTPTSFAANNIPLSVLTLNNRIVNANGFAAGTYGTRTVVTCS